MPSTSQKQHNFMAAVKHSPEFAREVGVPQSVGADFTAADRGGQYDRGNYTPSKKQHLVNALRRH